METISQQKIDEIRNASDIVEIVGECVQLSPAGKNLKGLCPFHNEKTPSFFVSPEKKTFHCFGCGENGTVISFLQKYKRMSFIEALRSLADRYHIDLDVSAGAGPDEKAKRLFEITEAATGFYSLALTNLASGKPALDYLKNRGLDIHTVQYFEIGLAPNEFDALYQALSPKYQELDLLELGLIKKTPEGTYYDLFRDRIIFPIRNEFGKVVGYSGRLFRENANEPNKYVNSPFTTIFTKGEHLYNLDRAQPAIRTKKRVILYEGFMDVIASVRAGLKEAVASMGTSLTPEQARLIKKYSDHVLLCYDGDSAGFEAMDKAIPILEGAGLTVTLLVLPEGLDPDDYLRKYSPKQYADYVENNQIDKYEFHYRHLKKHTDFSKASDIERFKIALFTYLLQQASETVQEFFLKTLAKDAGVELSAIQSDFRHFRISKALTHQLEQKRKTRETDIRILPRDMQAEMIILAYYAKAKEYREIIRAELPELFCKDSFHSLILFTIDDVAKDDPNANLFEAVPLRFYSQNREDVRKILAFHQHEFSVQELLDCIDGIRLRQIDQEITTLKARMNELRGTDNNLEIAQLAQKIVEEKKRKDAIHGKKRNPQKID